MNNSFSCSRIRYLIRRYFNENYRQLSMAIGVVFGIMLFFGITINKTIDDYDHFNGTGAVLWIVLFCIISFSMSVIGSLTFSSMSTKPKRIVAMMIPASKAEKFVSLLLIYNLILPFLIILSALLVDALTSLLFLHQPFFIQLLGNMGKFFMELKGFDYGLEIFFGVLAVISVSLLSSMAIYTLGSALWPKKSFIKTFCVLFAVQVFMPYIIPVDLMAKIIRNIRDAELDHLRVHILAWGAIVLGYAFTGLIYWLAWIRFRSTQLIQKFMMD